MLSPTQQSFDYRKNESQRSRVGNAINSVKIDLKMETLTKGRPYTLRITKTQATYKRLLGNWEADMRCLRKLKER